VHVGYIGEKGNIHTCILLVKKLKDDLDVFGRITLIWILVK
jgi:hypothetical protein